jgi:sterol desaturase/sphingolipid hydroxylase (fatty acid hydroxylase superfamily)
MTNYIALAVPLFFVSIAVEVLIARKLRRPVYRPGDAVTDLGSGVASEMSKVFLHAFLIAGYLHLYRTHRLFELSPSSPLPWVFTFFAVDFIYYWWHRLSHEVNVLWAAHVVHHSSEDYNLAVALRQAITTNLTGIPFYLPLALIGIPPVVYYTIHSFNTLYQFWIHTQLIGKLGPVELVMNTPSQHRVHHAINPRYLDKNYGGTLMIWDRLFGTFEEETWSSSTISRPCGRPRRRRPASSTRSRCGCARLPGRRRGSPNIHCRTG